MTMRTSDVGVTFIQGWEQLRLEAYQDVAGIWTCGFGTIRIMGGRRVREGDTCTPTEADLWFRYDLGQIELDMDALTIDTVIPRQFDGLMSWGYNLGATNYKGSTLRRLVNVDPNNPNIRQEYMKWHYADNRPVKGLWRRRWSEADLYFGETTMLPPWPHK